MMETQQARKPSSPDLRFFDSLINAINGYILNHHKEISDNKDNIVDVLASIIEQIHLYASVYTSHSTNSRILSSANLGSDQPELFSLLSQNANLKLPPKTRAPEKLEDTMYEISVLIRKHQELMSLISADLLEQTIGELKRESREKKEKEVSSSTTFSTKRFPRLSPQQKEVSVFEEFDPNQFYLLRDEAEWVLEGDSHHLKPGHEGISLLSQYYAEKYQTQILLVSDVKEIEQTIARIRNQAGNFRQAFILGGPNTIHSIPVVYIKENGKEGLLIADSKGDDNKRTRADVNWLAEQTGINVYVTPDVRQADDYSCHLDAVLICRDATALNADQTGYRLPDLLEKLEARSPTLVKDEKYFHVKLPNDLLKTAQISAFVKKNIESKDRIIDVGITLDQFLKNHAEMLEIKFAPAKSVNGYLRQKGFKVADTIEIQFYVNQFAKVLKNDWKPLLRKEFIKAAKAELRSQGDPFQENRVGLLAFSQKFLEQTQLKIQSNSSNVRSTSGVETNNSGNSQLSQGGFFGIRGRDPELKAQLRILGQDGDPFFQKLQELHEELMRFPSKKEISRALGGLNQALNQAQDGYEAFFAKNEGQENELNKRCWEAVKTGLMAKGLANLLSKYDKEIQKIFVTPKNARNLTRK